MIEPHDWELIGVTIGEASLLRLKVPGGWFVHAGGSVFFYPDPHHLWDGNSLKR